MTLTPDILIASAKACGFGSEWQETPKGIRIKRGPFGAAVVPEWHLWNPLENDEQLVMCIEALIRKLPVVPLTNKDNPQFAELYGAMSVMWRELPEERLFGPWKQAIVLALAEVSKDQ